MASSIKYPDASCLYFLEGDSLALVTNVDSSGTQNTSLRKRWKAIQEAVTDGLLLWYHAEPNNITSINDTPDIDNSLHYPIVDFVKRCLYMDRAGSSPDPNTSSVAMNMAQFHENKWNEGLRRYGMRKRDKVGGTRAIKLPNLT